MRFEKDIKLILNEEIYEAMKGCMEKARPHESCGLLFGKVLEKRCEGEKNEFYYEFKGSRFVGIESNRKSQVAFLLDDFEQLHEIIRGAMTRDNDQLISIFHSHPAGNHPSGIDVGHMSLLDGCGVKTFKNQVWTIMCGMTHEVRGYMLLDAEMIQVDVKVSDDE